MEKFDRKKFKPAKAIVMFKYQISRQFAELRDYINETNDLIKNEQTKIEKFVNEELNGLEDSDEAREVIEFYIEDIDKYAATYTELLMNSTFVSSFSLFESSFVRICNYGQKEKNIIISVADLGGNSIASKCKKYVEKGLVVDLEDLNNDWKDLTDYNKIRNLIVHNASNFKREKDKSIDKQQMYSFVSKNPYIKQKHEKHGFFYINDNQFVIDFSNKAEKYLLNVIDQILKK